MPLLYLLCWTQGVYYLLTAIWPLIHIDSFMWVTGPKYDIWLVKTVGLMILAVGVGLLASAYWRELSRPIMITALFSSFSLAGIDIYYSFIGHISKIYLLDAVPELIMAVMWLWGLYRVPEFKSKQKHSDITGKTI